MADANGRVAHQASTVSNGLTIQADRRGRASYQPTFPRGGGLIQALAAKKHKVADQKLIKSWKVTETLLERARRALPEPTGENREGYLNLLSEYRQFLEHNELELALDMLEELGNLVHCRGGFWRDLERAAENMNLKERIPKLRKKFSEARVPNEKTSS